MIVKEYTITIRVEAMTNDDFPSINGLINGLNDGLPDDWFSRVEGDDFSIQGWTYNEVNNPKYIGVRDSTDGIATWDEVAAAADELMGMSGQLDQMGEST